MQLPIGALVDRLGPRITLGVGLTFWSNRVASLGAVQNFGGYLGGALAPILTGSLAQSPHSFVPALLTGAVIAFVSAMIYLFGVRDPIS